MPFLFDTVLTIKLDLKPEPSTLINKVIAYHLKRANQRDFIDVLVPVRFTKMCLMITNTGSTFRLIFERGKFLFRYNKVGTNYAFFFSTSF